MLGLYSGKSKITANDELGSDATHLPDGSEERTTKISFRTADFLHGNLNA
jgi:hypothetical protein